MKHESTRLTPSDDHAEAARELKAFLESATSVALLCGGTTRARTRLATEAIETTRRWLRVSKPTREQAFLALDLLPDGTVLLDGIGGTDAMDVAERVIKDAHAGSRRRVILSSLLDDLGHNALVTRIHLPSTPKLTPRAQNVTLEAAHAQPANR